MPAVLILVWILAGFALLGRPPMAMAQDSPADLMSQASHAFAAGEGSRAIELADKAIAAEPKQAFWVHRRGEWKFRLGRVADSIEDFDRAIVLRPDIAPHSWQRGISYYYAGEYEKGARQFEFHQTVNSNDVENAVWHFLCVARWKGLDEALRRFIPIRGDPRVPMMQVHALFAGNGRPEDVLSAAAAGDPPPRDLHERMFFAHLYLGLYFEGIGEPEKSLDHIRQSVERYPAPHYMGDVARVHLKLRAAEAQP
jgi:lipoprotein NlpI